MPTLEPEVVIYNKLNTNWNAAAIEKPVLVVREDASTLKYDVGDEGLVLVYTELGGIRKTMVANWLHKDEVATIIVDIRTLRAHDHLFLLTAEATRILEVDAVNVAPWHLCSVLTVQQRYNSMFNFWQGQMRVELARYSVPTALVS